jgi:hypothetical protein
LHRQADVSSPAARRGALLLGLVPPSAGMAGNVVLRVAIALMSVHAIVNGQDQRYAGKSLGPRDVIITLGFAMLFPLFWRLRYRGRVWQRYPWWYDNLYLSIFAVDMAGNFFDLYNTYPLWFNHLPHTHGPGALAIVLAGAFGFPILTAVGLATIFHVYLEVEELYGDVLFGTHNFLDKQYEMNDLVFGLIGVTLYGLIWWRWSALRRKRARRVRHQRV